MVQHSFLHTIFICSTSQLCKGIVQKIWSNDKASTRNGYMYIYYRCLTLEMIFKSKKISMPLLGD